MAGIFDEIIDRRNTNSYKWDIFSDPEDMIPMPVADMDFRCPPAILNALQKVTDHGVMGYSFVPEEMKGIFRERLKEHYNWNTQIEWQVWIPGLVPAITAVCRAVGGMDSDSEILAGIPVYRPIITAPEWVNKKSVRFPMKYSEGRWSYDFEALETSITPKTKLLILCNPHNPLGTVFTKEELEKVTAICSKYKLLICSDEVHCDLILDKNKKHIPIASLGNDVENRSFTLMAPSKTFNIAGLGCSVAIIPNPDLREQFLEAKNGFFPELSPYAIAGGLAAYRDCEDWRKELVTYLKVNHDFLFERINQMKGLSMHRHEATYLAWIQCEDENFSNKLLEYGVRVIDGVVYGQKGYFRLNFGCPRVVLEEAINRIEKAVG